MPCRAALLDHDARQVARHSLARALNFKNAPNFDVAPIRERNESANLGRAVDLDHIEGLCRLVSRPL
jgi:hypothetical protein